MISLIVWWLFLVAVLSMDVTKEFSNFVTEDQLLEKLDHFMNQPKYSVEVFEDFYTSGVFQRDLKAPDRDFALNVIFSIMSTYKDTGHKISYALEDGMYLGYVYSDNLKMTKLVYREPGESGYKLNDELKSSEQSTYFNTCVDSETGEDQNCTLNAGEKYISCIDDCELTRCNDEKSQLSNCSAFASESVFYCESKIKWCKNYEIKESVGIEGYIPRYEYCMNSKGAISEKRGEIMKNISDGKIIFGDCTFGSGKLVQRNLTGHFAQCQSNEECNTPYVGGHLSENYDPRYRGWYSSAKKTQRPEFSNIFTFAASKLNGITYSHPIYKNDRNRNIFYGVIAAHLSLGSISSYLQHITEYNKYTYGIYEDKPPHNMVSVSTGTSLANKICTGNGNQRECIELPLSIHEMGKYSFEDLMLLRAHKELEIGGFASNKVVIFSENKEKLDSLLHMATSQIYEQPERNLKWRIVRVWPLEEHGSDEITKSDKIFVIVFTFAILGFLVCAALFVVFFMHRKERAVQLSDFQLSSAYIIGCAFINLGALAYLGTRTDLRCNLSVWLVNTPLFFILSVLIVKMHRLHHIVVSADHGRRSSISNRKAWLYVIPIPLVEVLLLTVFSIVDPYKAVSTVGYAMPPQQSVECVRKYSHSLSIVQIVYLVLVTVCGCILAFRARKVDSRFEDVKVVLFAMYNISFVIIVYGTIIFSVENLDPPDMYVINTICIFVATLSSSAALTLPRLSMAKKDRESFQARLDNFHSADLHSKRYLSDICRRSIHNSGETLKILICSSNMGNAPPTLASMKAWIPENGGSASMIDDKTIDESTIDATIDSSRFHIIVIGMQEATWGKTKDDMSQDDESPTGSATDQRGTIVRRNSMNSIMSQEDNYLLSVHAEDTVVLNSMEKNILGEEYISIAQEQRGQMRLHIYAWNRVVSSIENIKISGANTGVGNVMANKGGIVVSFEYQKTRFTFLSAHLAAHEGKSYYRTRCDNVQDILRQSQTFDLSKIMDVAVSSHHMFVFGDLNFRTKIATKDTNTSESVIMLEEDLFYDSFYDESNDKVVKEPSINDATYTGSTKKKDKEHILHLLEAKDWSSLYGYDELSRGLKKGDLLVNFETLPCTFSPTFKVKRSAGFEYNEQRTPSYTDRILYKSATSLKSHLKQLSYEACADFITSDHKPIRGAFSVILNDMIEPITVPSTFQLIFNDVECSGLKARDVNGKSDPYITFVWDSITLEKAPHSSFSFCNDLFKLSKWPQTTCKWTTLHPKWYGKRYAFKSTSKIVNHDAAMFFVLYDYDIFRKDEFLGVLPLSIQELVSMKDATSRKGAFFDMPIEHYGKHAGRIKFKVKVQFEMTNESIKKKKRKSIPKLEF